MRRLALVVVLVLGLGFGAGWGWGRSVGCGWPMRVSGDAGRGPTGAVNCSLRSLAEDDRSGLATVMVQPDDGPPNHVTDADLRDAADARRGVARVSLVIDQAAPDIVFVKITYADGVVEHTSAQREAVYGLGGAWKVEFGSN